jgi:hypothetical protein
VTGSRTLQQTARRAPAVVHEVVRSAGQPLDASVGAFFGRQFGHDFSQVRVHADEAAARSSEALGAQAYTRGLHIAFAGGSYRPESAEGRRLLAHELTHVVQQRRSATRSFSSGSTSGCEREADEAARQVDREDRVPEFRLPRGPVFQVREVLHGPAVARSAIDAGSAEKFADEDSAVGIPEALSAEEDDPQDGDSPPGAGLTAVPDLEAGPPSELAGIPYIPEADLVQAQMKPAASRRKVPASRELRDIPATALPWWITRIDIDLTAQTLTLGRSDDVEFRPVPISSGKGQPNTKGDPCAKPEIDGSLCTPPGTYTPDARGGEGYVNSKGNRMSWYVQFLSARGIGIHDSQPVTGAPASHGCVRVDPGTARLINEHVARGTVIDVHGKAPTKPWTPKKRGRR